MFKGAKEKVRKTVYLPLEVSQAIERRANGGDYASFSAIVARILLKELEGDIAGFNTRHDVSRTRECE